ncbi:MAG: ligase-associated DNA damage response exonuclease [Weeksellaceae bacterium]|nr:ligase-associated DNA damage response exonuclease [Weeksellaceae bacterium]
MVNFLELTSKGLYCVPGDFYIDPWFPVDKAVISHAHADHARRGMQHYLCHTLTKPILQLRLGAEISVDTLQYGEKTYINGVTLSLHPAGHLIGSSQIRVEYKGQVAVFSGDYKLHDDNLSTPFEPVKCHSFITESTFGLPIYRWKAHNLLTEEIRNWTIENHKAGKNTVFFGYSLGKAQDVLQMLDNIAPIYAHSAVKRTNDAFDAVGVKLPEHDLAEYGMAHPKSGNIYIMPPALLGSRMVKRIPNAVTAVCSGWMQVRGRRRWNAVDAGFAVSDHADWDGLLQAVAATEADEILVTHGYTEVFSRYLRELGYNAHALETQFGGDDTDTDEVDEMSGDAQNEVENG